MKLVLPAVRADFALAETYRYAPGTLLPMPITVLAGKSDPYQTVEQAEGWRDETTGSVEVEWFEGDHFFLRPSQQEVIKCINLRLARRLAPIA